MAHPDTLDPSHLMMVGDTHSRIDDWRRKIIPTAITYNIKVLVVTGDFETTDYGGADFSHYRDFISRLTQLLAVHNITVAFVDGNHDRHSFLAGLMREQHINHDAFVRVRDNIWYIPRGHTWTWSGKRFMGLGGAYSITADRDGQIARGVYEWNEIIDPADMWRALGLLRSDIVNDVLVTHDCPMEVPLAALHAGVRPWTRGDSPETDRNRQFVSQVFQLGKFGVCFHGHYHLAYTHELKRPHGARPQRVVGLGANAEHGSIHLLDLTGERVMSRPIELVSLRSR